MTKKTELWSQKEVDELLNKGLECNCRDELRSVFARLALKFNRSYKAVDRYFWGVGSRISQQSYDPGPTRMLRQTGVTWADRQMIKNALESRTTDPRRLMGPSTPEHLTKVLLRTKSQILVEGKRFGLKKKIPLLRGCRNE